MVLVDTFEMDRNAEDFNRGLPKLPINIPKGLPAIHSLRHEKIFVMEDERSLSQDIRPLNILILNLMPEKEKTEMQLLRLLGNTPLQVNVTFLRTATHESKNVSKSHLDSFYHTFSAIRKKRYDGLIITGAPVEHLAFEEVDYWPEMLEIMEWSNTNVTSTLHICWGAQAALYHHYGINKFHLPAKCSGVYTHKLIEEFDDLVRGFNDIFHAPVSRYTSVELEKIIQEDRLQLLSTSEEAGVFLIVSNDKKHVLVTGHLEYDANTLAEEYTRDLSKGLAIDMPKYYYPEDNHLNKPLNTWRAHTHLLFSNWLNYYVYQETPYIWE